ncbi:MAG: hypothetical protein JKY61_08375 [Planctomycetes bacterium]|nr:hypothetical protein [Planctomycetota bacterium]
MKASTQSGAGGASLNLDERFHALRAHPEWTRLEAFTPEDAGKASPFAIVFGVLFMGAWLTIGGSVTSGFAMAGAEGMALFPLAIVSFGAIAMLMGAVRYGRFRKAPVVGGAALVVDERVKVSGGGKDSSARTRYFTTLEFPGGKRAEYPSLSEAAAQACPGDVGMAYLRHGTLVHFARVGV